MIQKKLIYSSDDLIKINLVEKIKYSDISDKEKKSLRKELSARMRKEIEKIDNFVLVVSYQLKDRNKPYVSIYTKDLVHI